MLIVESRLLAWSALFDLLFAFGYFLQKSRSSIFCFCIPLFLVIKMLFAMGDDLSYGLNTLGPLCLWQCFKRKAVETIIWCSSRPSITLKGEAWGSRMRGGVSNPSPLPGPITTPLSWHPIYSWRFQGPLLLGPTQVNWGRVNLAETNNFKLIW